MRQSIFFSSHPWELFFCDVLYCMFCVLWCYFPYVCFRPVTGSVWTFLIFVRVSFPFSLSLVYSVCIGTFVVKALLRHFTNTRTNLFPGLDKHPITDSLWWKYGYARLFYVNSFQKMKRMYYICISERESFRFVCCWNPGIRCPRACKYIQWFKDHRCLHSLLMIRANQSRF